MQKALLLGAVFAAGVVGMVADAQERVPGVVTYEEFGAVGDGKADDQSAIVAAHAAANEKGLPVKAGDGKTYYIGGGDAVAVVKTDVDFGTAKFVIDDRKLKNHRAPIFRIVSDARPFAVKGVKALARGQAKLDVSLPSDCLLIAVNNKAAGGVPRGTRRHGRPARADRVGLRDGHVPLGASDRRADARGEGRRVHHDREPGGVEVQLPRAQLQRGALERAP